MNSEQNNKGKILSQSKQEETKKSEKKELINSQTEKSLKDNTNDEGKPIHNYPYEFYEKQENKQDINQKIIPNNEEIKKDNKKLIKEEKPIIEKIPKEMEKNNEQDKNQIIKIEAVQNKMENEAIKQSENKIVLEIYNKVGGEEKKEEKIKEDKKEITKEEDKKENNEIKELKEIKKEDIKEEEKKEIKDKKEIPKEVENKVKKEIKEIKKENVKESDIKVKKEIKQENIKKEDNNKEKNKIKKKVIKEEIKEDIKKIDNKEIKKEIKKEMKEEKPKLINKDENKVIKGKNNKVIKEEKKEPKEKKEKDMKIIKEKDNKNIKEEKKVSKKEEKKVLKEKPKERKVNKEEEKKLEKKESKQKLKSPQKKDENIRKFLLNNMNKKDLEAPLPQKEEQITQKAKEIKMKKEIKESKKILEKKPINQLEKTKLTQQTENNYNLMIQQLKNKDYKNKEDYVISNIINSDNKILYNDDNDKVDNYKKKELIEDFIQRNIDDIQYRQNNTKTINDRLKIADEGSKKRMFFNSKEEEQDYFDEFYNKQIQFKNNCQVNLDRLTQQLNEEEGKKYIPEPKNKTNLNYFKNKNIVELSKYKKEAKIKQENKKVNENEKNNIPLLKSKKPMNNTQNNFNNNKNNTTNKSKESKNDNISNKNKPKLTKKEIDELTNKLHYEGELLKVKKQTMISDEFANNPNYHNFSKDKLSRASLIILIKKFIYEYSTSVKKNSYLDCIKNPKLNYDQYIDILKDLYYLEKDALPEDYLEDDTMYKELWDKLTKFSKGPENSLESNILLLYFLELNGFFRNEKLVKELETEIHWIKLDEYEELIANAKFIEENWDDLKLKKIENIKRLKSLKKYNPIHNEEIFNNNTFNTNSNTNLDSINVNDSNHYITIIKGNTNYELIHGYSTKKKDDKNDSFSELSNDKNKINNNYNSLTISNNITKNNKNRVTLQDGYNEIILKKQTDIEYLKQKEEKKLKESCTFKPTINSMNKKMFNNNTKVDLPKHRMNKSVNIYNNGNNNINKTNIKLRKNKSNLQKMFDTNPLKNDKGFNERVQILKSVKSNEINDDNYLITPMRFNIDYPSKFEGMGITINRESGIRQFAPNIIFYNIKVNDKIRTLKYIEGDDLKLNVINFVKKNKLPEEVVNIILKKIKEKELEEKMENQS